LNPATASSKEIQQRINELRPAVTKVPGLRLAAGTPPAQIYNKTIWTSAARTTNALSDDWLTETISLNTWLNDVTYTTDNTGIINIKNQIFPGPIDVNGTTGAVFNIHNSVFNTDITTSTVTWQQYGTKFFLSDDLFVEETPAQKIRRKLRGQWKRNLAEELGHLPRAALGPANFKNVQHNELVALGLLKSMVTTDVWRKYLKYGFVTVQGQSGLTYKIVRSSAIITVLNRGQKMGTLCVYLNDRSIPPTDAIVAKMLICECDERDIWMRANVRWDSDQIRQHDTILGLGVQDKGYGSNNRIVFENYPRQTRQEIVQAVA
jgi:hypothetical protein